MNTTGADVNWRLVEAWAREKTSDGSCWQSIIAEQQAGGKWIHVFCRERDLGEHSFYAWRQRLRGEKDPVALALVDIQPLPQAVTLELTLASGEELCGRRGDRFPGKRPVLAV